MPGVTVFEQQSGRYESWFEKNAAAYRSELRAIQALMPESTNGLEIGVGSGLFAAPLGIRRGIDPSIAMLERAKARGIDVIQGVAESLPFAEEEFDFALMVTTVCFLDDIDAAFREAYRVLKPGGSFLIGFVDKNSPIGKAYEEEKSRSLFYKDATFYAAPDLVAHLTHAGFRTLRFVQTLFHLLPDIKDIEPAREGYGEGSFVVIRTEK